MRRSFMVGSCLQLFSVASGKSGEPDFGWRKMRTGPLVPPRVQRFWVLLSQKHYLSNPFFAEYSERSLPRKMTPDQQGDIWVCFPLNWEGIEVARDIVAFTVNGTVDSALFCNSRAHATCWIEVVLSCKSWQTSQSDGPCSKLVAAKTSVSCCSQYALLFQTVNITWLKWQTVKFLVVELVIWGFFSIPNVSLISKSEGVRCWFDRGNYTEIDPDPWTKSAVVRLVQQWGAYRPLDLVSCRCAELAKQGCSNPV